MSYFFGGIILFFVIIFLIAAFCSNDSAESAPLSRTCPDCNGSGSGEFHCDGYPGYNCSETCGSCQGKGFIWN